MFLIVLQVDTGPVGVVVTVAVEDTEGAVDMVAAKHSTQCSNTWYVHHHSSCCFRLKAGKLISFEL